MVKLSPVEFWPRGFDIVGPEIWRTPSEPISESSQDLDSGSGSLSCPGPNNQIVFMHSM